MADSDSTNARVTDVAGDLETMQDTLRILNDLTNDQACAWCGDDDKEAVGRMVERVIVLTNTMRDRIDELGELVSKAYKIGFESKAVEVAHV